MDSEEFCNKAERIALLITVMRNAEIAMSLTNGWQVQSGQFRGTLQFDRQIAGLQAALMVLGIDDPVFFETCYREGDSV